MSNDQIIERLFGKRTLEDVPFSKETLKKLGEGAVGEDIRQATIKVKRKVLNRNMPGENPVIFKEEVETHFLERRIQDLDDKLLNRQIDNLRKIPDFIDFIVD